MKFEKPIVFFDCETTGTSVSKDKIIEIYCKKMIPLDSTGGPDSSFKFEDLHLYFNPGFKIPQEAIDIHGITNEFVSDKPSFSEKAKFIYEFFQGADISGYNIIRFDIPMLVEELLRCGIDPDFSDAKVMDPFIIFCKQYPRDLHTVYKFYNGFGFDGAHAASNDVEASISVFMRQIEQHQDMGTTPEEVAKYCKGDQEFADFDGKIGIYPDGVHYYTFGKAKGVPVLHDPGFGEWMLRQDFITLNTKRIIRKILKK